MNAGYRQEVKKIRLKLGMQPREFCREMGLEWGDYISWCYGHTPDTGLAMALSHLLGVPAEDLERDLPEKASGGHSPE